MEESASITTVATVETTNVISADTTATTTTTKTTMTLVTVTEEEDEERRQDGADGAPMAVEESVTLAVRWQQQSELELRIPLSSTVGDVKGLLATLTGVLPPKQKLLGLSKGRLPADTTPLSQLGLKPVCKVTLIGTPEESLAKTLLKIEDMPIVMDDLDMDYNSSLAAVHVCHEKLAATIKASQIHLISTPREGKKLLVLDIDHTIMDFASGAIPVDEMKRPGLDAFLEAVYPYYDIAIWSQTSWRWLETKLTEMNMLTNSKYSLLFVLDKTVMFPVETTHINRKGQRRTHHVKPLELIWSKFSRHYTRRNTVHIDDLAQNFALNSQNGLKISPFKASMGSRDTALFSLRKYLVHIGHNFEDFSALVHNDWEAYITKHGL